MIKSMTGYGKAEVSAPGRKITVEIRSLNSKQLDLSVKLPSPYRPLEWDVRALAAKEVQRGKVDIYVTVETTAPATATINEELFQAYFKRLSVLSNTMVASREGLDAAIMGCVMRLPDVVTADSGAQFSDAERDALLGAVEEALGAFDAFRTQEGATLKAELLGRINLIEQGRAAVEPFEKRRTEAIKARIRESIASVGIPVDENRLEQEMIFYVEKLDVTEEKVRLDNHCRYFREVVDSEDAPGRKLGFIAQEIGREINTLGSKANDKDMQRTVVEMKDELEKIKEQVLNVL